MAAEVKECSQPQMAAIGVGSSHKMLAKDPPMMETFVSKWILPVIDASWTLLKQFLPREVKESRIISLLLGKKYFGKKEVNTRKHSSVCHRAHNRVLGVTVKTVFPRLFFYFPQNFLF